MPDRTHPDDTSSAIATIDRTIAAFPELELVVLFGSISSGRAHAESDVDIAVLAAAPLSVEQRMDLIEAIALALGRPVDLVDLHTAGEPVLNQIVTTGVRIRGSDNAWGRIIYKNIMENTDFVPLQERILKARRDTWIGK